MGYLDTPGGSVLTSTLLLQHFLDVRLVGEHQYSASLLHSHDTSTRATMNVAVGDGVIAAGQDGTCCVMKTHVSKEAEGSRAAAGGEGLLIKAVADVAEPVQQTFTCLPLTDVPPVVSFRVQGGASGRRR